MRPDLRVEYGATRHGKGRFRERVKLPLRALRRMSAQAMSEGLPPERVDYATRLKLASIQERLDPEGNCYQRVYRGFLFVIAKDTNALVTVYPLDREIELDQSAFKGKRKNYDKPF